MENDTMYETAKFYLIKKGAVHISKTDNRFLNGIIKDVRNDFLILEDEKLGEMPVFFTEIKFIEPRKEKR